MQALLYKNSHKILSFFIASFSLFTISIVGSLVFETPSNQEISVSEEVLNCGRIDVNNNQKVDVEDYISYLIFSGSSCQEDSRLYPPCGKKDFDSNGVLNESDLKNFENLYNKGDCN